MPKSKDKKLVKYELPLDGKLITGQDSSKIGPNYQSLVNMRYHKKTIKGIGGMSKVNSTALSTYLKTRSAHHFKKDQPAESHVLAESWNTGLTAARIWQNTTAIGSDGDFSATSLYTPTSTTPGGKFSDAPDGDCAYCNGSESLIWGGAEREIAGFINYDPDGDFSYDFTEELRNTKTDSDSIASLTSTGAGIDSDTQALYHFDNAVTDSSGNNHTLTNANVTFSTSGYVFGTHWAVFTTNAKLTISDHADFDLGNGNFTLDAHVQLDDLSADYSIYYQNTANDDDSFNWMIDTNGAVLVRIKAGAAKQFNGAVDFTTADGVIEAGTTYHIEVDHSANDWYIFVDGTLRAYLSDAAEPADYTGDVAIGYDGTTYLEGKIDEFRVCSSTRHTSDFEVPTEAYGSSTTSVYMYIGSVRPLDGFKLYVNTANTSASSMSAYYWNGSGWTAVSSLSDGTSASSKSLAQTGSVTFTSTDGSAEVKYIDGVYVYWYKIVVDAVSSGTELYYATLSTPMQQIKDIWDGSPRLIDSFQVYDNSKYTGATLNVRENEYDSGNDGTSMGIDALGTGTDYIICGFIEKMSGVVFNFVSGEENDVAGTVATVNYWDGDDWANVGVIDDGTVTNNVSFAQSGAITWTPPSAEYTQTISNDVSLYYYKFSFSKTLATPTTLYYVSGVPSQDTIGNYSFPMLANDRLWLLDDNDGKRNSARHSAQSSSAVFNGEDSGEYTFGDDTALTGGAWLFSSVGSSIYNITIFFKRNETWALIGSGPDDWSTGKYRISSTVGCTAPHTIRVIDIGPEVAQTLNRNVVVWQASDGIYMSDGRSPIKLSDDISDAFDPRGSPIDPSYAHKSVATWDNYNKCYHWLYTENGATTHSTEFVFDFEKPGWFEIDRGAA